MKKSSLHAAAFAAAALIAMTGTAAAQPQDPAVTSVVATASDPAAPAARIPHSGGLADSYRPLPSLVPLPWRRLFDADAAFVDHDAMPAAAAPMMAQATQAAHHGHAADGAAAAPPAAAASPATAAPAASAAATETPGGADSTATVLRIDREAKRVRLRHGPIPKLEMPGMTMLFQVADPVLLDQVSEGETVGFRVEQRGQAFVVTEWVRER